MTTNWISEYDHGHDDHAAQTDHLPATCPIVAPYWNKTENRYACVHCDQTVKAVVVRTHVEWAHTV